MLTFTLLAASSETNLLKRSVEFFCVGYLVVHTYLGKFGAQHMRNVLVERRTHSCPDFTALRERVSSPARARPRRAASRSPSAELDPGPSQRRFVALAVAATALCASISDGLPDVAVAESVTAGSVVAEEWTHRRSVAATRQFLTCGIRCSVLAIMHKCGMPADFVTMFIIGSISGLLAQETTGATRARRMRPE